MSFINLTDTEFVSKYSAGIRVVYSVGEDQDSYWVIDTGISESVFSKHYTDQMKLYQYGKYVKIVKDRKMLNQLPH